MIHTTSSGCGVAVLGTGLMGLGMARSLAEKGLRTTVWDRSETTTAALADAAEAVLRPVFYAIGRGTVWLPRADTSPGQARSAVALGAVSRAPLDPAPPTPLPSPSAERPAH